MEIDEKVIKRPKAKQNAFQGTFSSVRSLPKFKNNCLNCSFEMAVALSLRTENFEVPKLLMPTDRRRCLSFRKFLLQLTSPFLQCTMCGSFNLHFADFRTICRFYITKFLSTEKEGKTMRRRGENGSGITPPHFTSSSYRHWYRPYSQQMFYSVTCGDQKMMRRQERASLAGRYCRLSLFQCS